MHCLSWRCCAGLHQRGLGSMLAVSLQYPSCSPPASGIPSGVSFEICLVAFQLPERLCYAEAWFNKSYWGIARAIFGPSDETAPLHESFISSYFISATLYSLVDKSCSTTSHYWNIRAINRSDQAQSPFNYLLCRPHLIAWLMSILSNEERVRQGRKLSLHARNGRQKCSSWFAVVEVGDWLLFSFCILAWATLISMVAIVVRFVYVLCSGSCVGPEPEFASFTPSKTQKLWAWSKVCLRHMDGWRWNVSLDSSQCGKLSPNYSLPSFVVHVVVEHPNLIRCMDWSCWTTAT